MLGQSRRRPRIDDFAGVIDASPVEALQTARKGGIQNRIDDDVHCFLLTLNSKIAPWADEPTTNVKSLTHVNALYYGDNERQPIRSPQ
jgi:hypothetical protein